MSQPMDDGTMGNEPAEGRSAYDRGGALPYARKFQDLMVWRKARALAREAFVATRTFPQEERFALTDQLRRASRSIGAQLAESWAKRLYPRHFVTKLSDADGEQMETQHWLTVAFDCGYLTPEQTTKLGEHCLEIGRMLGDMLRRADSFCQPGLHEDTTPYFVNERNPEDSPS